MYASGFLTVLIIPFWNTSPEPISLVLLGVILLLPGGIDGTTQLLSTRASTNRIRVLTGLLLGPGIVLVLFSSTELLFRYLGV